MFVVIRVNKATYSPYKFSLEAMNLFEQNTFFIIKASFVVEINIKIVVQWYKKYYLI